MAHFAKLKSRKVVNVVTVNNNELLIDGVENEQKGIDFLNNLYGTNDVWKQTSYNNNFRKNYAGIGFIYDEARDAFISPKTYDSWIFNETTCRWEAPIAKPDDGKVYRWNEKTESWKEIIS